MKLNRTNVLSVVASICLLATASVRAATHTWTGGGANEFWNNAANWSGGAPVAGEAAPVILIFPSSVLTTNNIVGLTVDGLRFTGGSVTLHGSGGGALIFRGTGGTNIYAYNGNNLATHTIETTLPITLNSSNYCRIEGSTTVNINSVISGSGSVDFAGSGNVRYGGTAANTATGKISLREDLVMFLAKTAGQNAVAGPLDLLDYTRVLHEAANQISDASVVTIDSLGSLELSGFDDTIGSLSIDSGQVTTANGLLTMNGNINAIGAGGTIWGRLSLGGAIRTVQIGNSQSISIRADISNGGLIKSGAGQLSLYGTNTFTGSVSVSGGTLELHNNSALGSIAGATTVSPGCILRLFDVDIGAESLTLNGTLDTVYTNSWAGPINVASESTIALNSISYELTLSGAVTGAGSLTKNGVGTLIFSGTGANTFSGGLATSSGLVLLNKTGVNALAGPLQIGPGTATVRLLQANQIADSVAISMYAGNTLDLNGLSDTIGSLSGSGSVNLIFGTLTTGGDNSSTTFSGNIGGVGFTPLIKNGSGTFTLSGTNNCTGVTTINAGTLAVTGQLDSNVSIAAGGTLKGSGKVGNVVANAGSILPGTVVGTLNTGALNLTNAATTLTFEIYGNTPGATHDQIAATGAVNLSNPTLALSLNTYGALSNQYVLIANDGADAVKGTFAGMPEGATITSGLVSFKITYQGGTGNDVVLIQTAAPASPVITNITKQVNGNMVVSATGTAGLAYYFDATDNLNPPTWVNLTAGLANVSGVVSFTDADAPNHPQRFYRLRMQ